MGITGLLLITAALSSCNPYEKGGPIEQLKADPAIAVQSTPRQLINTLEPAEAVEQAPIRTPPSAGATSTRTPQPIQATPTEPPESSDTAQPEAITATVKLPCYRATFIEDVTYRDGTSVLPGEIFLKIWRFRNDGSCEWNFSFHLEHYSGERLSGPDDINAKFFDVGAELELEPGDRDWTDTLVHRVQPGDTVDIPLLLRAPLEEGRHRGHWRVLTQGEETVVIEFYVDIDVAFTIEREVGLWGGEWEHRTEWIDPNDNPLVFDQRDRRVIGYYYKSDGEVFLIDANLSSDGMRMEGSFGQAQQAGYPFTLELFPNGKAFHGMYNESPFNAGAWCGSRPGFTVPLGECLLEP